MVISVYRSLKHVYKFLYSYQQLALRNIGLQESTLCRFRDSNLKCGLLLINQVNEC